MIDPVDYDLRKHNEELEEYLLRYNEIRDRYKNRIEEKLEEIQEILEEFEDDLVKNGFDETESLKLLCEMFQDTIGRC